MQRERRDANVKCGRPDEAITRALKAAKTSNFLYCVIVLTESPTLKSEPETGVQTEEMSSTSVMRIVPTGAVILRITTPVDGSLISRVTRSTVSWSPTFNPAFAPTLRMIWPLSTAATSPETEIVRV